MLGPGTHATVICNPISGTHNVRDSLPAALDVLSDRGWKVDLQMTQQAGDMQRLAVTARDQRQNVVIVAGGDGSLNEAANALAYSEVALGVFPSGTANVWARQIGLPVPMPLYVNQLIDAARLLVDGVVRPIDLGRANDRCFMLWSGIGLDAHVTTQIEPRPIWAKRFGMIGYIWRGFWIALNFRGTRMTITVDDRRIKRRALMVLISNAQLYGGVVRAAPEAQLDDGWLDVTIVKGDNLFQAIPHLARIMLGRAAHDPKLISLRGKHIHVDAKRPCEVHVDAEPHGHTPINIEVMSKALRVLVPSSVPRELFSNG